MKGLKEREEYKLTKHPGVHVPAGYFYQIDNTGAGRPVLYQVSTRPNPTPAKGKIVVGIDTSLKEHLRDPVG